MQIKNSIQHITNADKKRFKPSSSYIKQLHQTWTTPACSTMTSSDAIWVANCSQWTTSDGVKYLPMWIHSWSIQLMMLSLKIQDFGHLSSDYVMGKRWRQWLRQWPSEIRWPSEINYTYFGVFHLGTTHFPLSPGSCFIAISLENFDFFSLLNDMSVLYILCITCIWYVYMIMWMYTIKSWLALDSIPVGLLWRSGISW